MTREPQPEEATRTLLVVSNHEIDATAQRVLMLSSRCRFFFASDLRRAADLLRFLRFDAVVTRDADLVEPLQAELALTQPVTRLIIWHGSWPRFEANGCSDRRAATIRGRS